MFHWYHCSLNLQPQTSPYRYWIPNEHRKSLHHQDLPPTQDAKPRHHQDDFVKSLGDRKSQPKPSGAVKSPDPKAKTQPHHQPQSSWPTWRLPHASSYPTRPTTTETQHISLRWIQNPWRTTRSVHRSWMIAFTIRTQLGESHLFVRIPRNKGGNETDWNHHITIYTILGPLFHIWESTKMVFKVSLRPRCITKNITRNAISFLPVAVFCWHLQKLSRAARSTLNTSKVIAM